MLYKYCSKKITLLLQTSSSYVSHGLSYTISFLVTIESFYILLISFKSKVKIAVEMAALLRLLYDSLYFPGAEETMYEEKQQYDYHPCLVLLLEIH